MDAAPAGRSRTWLLALLLALAGIALACVLIREHLTVFQGDVTGGLFCGGAGRFDCNVVAASPYAWLLGVPTPLWGLLFYVAMAALAVLAASQPPGERAAAASAGLLLAMVALAVDAALAFVMLTRIGAVCLNCVATYAVNLLLAVAFWRLDRAEHAPRAWRALLFGWRSPTAPPAVAAASAADAAAASPGPEPAAPAFRWGKLAVVASAISIALVVCVVTMRSVAGTLADSQDEAVAFLNDVATKPAFDMRALDDRPSRGPRDARVTIAVASDFECSFCRALWVRLDQIQREFPRDVRVVFLSAPLDQACNRTLPQQIHPHACWLAHAAVCAAEHGRFWEYHDLVYRSIALPDVDSSTVLRRAPEIGLPAAALDRCAHAAAADSVVQRDLAVWHRLKLESVPSLIINGHVKPGGIYPTTLRAIVRALLDRNR